VKNEVGDVAVVEMTNIEMIEMLKALNVQEAVAKNITNIKMNNIKMMNIIIKLKTRIKKKINKKMAKRNKTTDKKQILVVETANVVIVVVEVATEKKSLTIKTMVPKTKAMKMKIMALSCQKKNQNSIESKMTNTNQKITSKLIMMKKMKSMIRSLNKDKLSNPTEAPIEVEVKEEAAVAEVEEAAEAKKNTCQRIESREMAIIKRLRVRAAKATDQRTTSTMIMITVVAMVSKEMTTEEAVEAEVVEVAMAKNITTTNNKEKAQPEETNSESDINRIQKPNLLSLKTENSQSMRKTTKILPQRQNFKNNRPIDSPPWVTYLSE